MAANTRGGRTSRDDDTVTEVIPADGPGVQVETAETPGEAESAGGTTPAPPDAKDSGTAYLNVSGGPLVYDKAGHQVDTDCWTPPTSLDDIGKAHRRKRFLLPRSELSG